MALYFIFWDGVGLGKKDPSVNPFFSAQLPTMKKLFQGNLPSLSMRRFSRNGVSYSPVNTTLRVAGLPQSGTGQAAIMTGINTSRYVGKHFGPHPYSTLIPVIKEKNLFRQLQMKGFSYNFVNAYPKKYFDFLFGPKGKIPTIALSYLSTGRTLNDHRTILSGKGISADISGTRWKELGHPEVSSEDPSVVGKRFVSLGRDHTLAFFEYFLPDYAGHSQDMLAAVEVLERMDGFLEGMIDSFDASRDTIIMISDHGNIEDLSVKTHTRNPVPLIVIGKHFEYFPRVIKNLTQVAPAVFTAVTHDIQFPLKNIPV